MLFYHSGGWKLGLGSQQGLRHNRPSENAMDDDEMNNFRIQPRFMGFDMTLYDMANLTPKQRHDAQRIQDKAGLIGKVLAQAPGANVHLQISPQLTGATVYFDEAVWNSPEAKAASPKPSETISVYDRRQGSSYSGYFGHRSLISFVNDAIRHAIRVSQDPYLVMEHPAPPWPRVSHLKSEPKPAPAKPAWWWPWASLVS